MPLWQVKSLLVWLVLKVVSSETLAQRGEHASDRNIRPHQDDYDDEWQKFLDMLGTPAGIAKARNSSRVINQIIKKVNSKAIINEPAPGGVVPSGSDVWSPETRWRRVSESHPDGVVSTLPGRSLRWKDVSYISLPMVCVLCGVAYPAVIVGSLLALTVLVSMCLKVEQQYQKSGDAEAEEPHVSKDAQRQDVLQPFIDKLPILPKHKLTPASRRIYTVWATFCCAVPSIMVFGTPLLMTILARPFPQEVLAALTLLTSAFVFSNTLYMSVFACFGLCRMHAQSKVNPSDFAVDSSEKRQRLSAADVRHWVVLPQYKEEVEIVHMCLESVAQSTYAKSSIGIVLAMEEREPNAEGKAKEIIQEFQHKFFDMKVFIHPDKLPNDPAGKASNVAYAFRQLYAEVKDYENVVLTIADADSEFGAGYFESLSCQFAASQSRYRIWQSPVFHMKNYHRQPAPVVVGTMFTSMQELSGLTDPNAVRFPYSTYSLPMTLARDVGGWDVEWIAEDYHMGIKCFLMTLGKTTVEPIMSPVINYVPEKTDDVTKETAWWGTCMARWTQLQRHALGFSDFSYYFMMLPLVFSFSTSSSSRDDEGLRGFWRMLFCGTTLLVRLVNVHVLIGVLSTYGAMEFSLRVLMQVFFGDSRSQDVEVLLGHVGLFPRYLMAVTVLCTLAVAVVFFASYKWLLKPRIEGEHNLPPLLHFTKNVASLAWASPIYFLAMGWAIWRAAVLVLTQRSFEYHVAPKPKQEAGSCSEGRTEAKES